MTSGVQRLVSALAVEASRRVGTRQAESLRHVRRLSQRGGALLAVLWLTTALSAIILTLALTVRTELQRAGTAMDSTRAYFLAEGAIERFLLRLTWGEALRTDFLPGQRALRWTFPNGTVDLEITGENGKLSVYSAPREVLLRLFVFLGVDAERAATISGDVVARRQAGAQNNLPGSSFSSQWPSFLQLEDLLKVNGMTPEIFYGWWERDSEGRLRERGGAGRYLTLLPGDAVNVNYASPEVLRAAGVPDGAVAGLLQARQGGIIRDFARLGMLASAPLPGGMQLAAGGSNAYTVRATAQLNGRPVRRSVGALIRFGRSKIEPRLGVVRWYYTAN